MVTKLSWGQMKAQKWGLRMGPPYPIGKKIKKEETKKDVKEDANNVQTDK